MTWDLKGRRFQYTENIQGKEGTTALQAVPQQFQKCFRQWQHRWG